MLEQVLSDMLGDYERTHFPCQLFHQIYQNQRNRALLDTVPDYCMVLPRLWLTPCRTIVVGMEIEVSNRVTRAFMESHQFSSSAFIRLQL
jgi:hypothetical protein